MDGSPERAGHREIEHTADVGFEVWAPSLGALYTEATVAMVQVVFEHSTVRGIEQRQLEVLGADPEELLVRWLQEIYLLVEMESWLTARVERIAYEPGRVRGTLVGEPFDPNRHTLHTELKAITYHDLAIRRGEDRLWRTVVVVDV